MATGNLFLGSAKRSVGDVTMYIRNGKQISRVRRRTVSNPRSGLQLAQRCILKTVSTAYSVLAPICGQSFQGKQSRSMNQARFQKLNLNMLRTKAAAAVSGEGMTEAGIYENTTGNFVGKQTLGAVVNPYVISEGNLSFDSKYFIDTDDGFYLSVDYPIATVTYQQFIDALGLEPGDQLTFCVLTSDTTLEDQVAPNMGLLTNFLFCRVILMPSDGDMTSTLFTGSGGNYTINKPNSRNEGVVRFQAATVESTTKVIVAQIDGVGWELATNEGVFLGAAGIILSRQTNAGWQYSNCRLKVNTVTIGGVGIGNNFPLNAAVASFESTQDSSKYLDQARRVG